MMQYINQNDLDLVYSYVKSRLYGAMKRAGYSENIATFQKIKYKDLTIVLYSSFDQDKNNGVFSNFTFYIPLSRELGWFSLVPYGNINGIINSNIKDNKLNILFIILGLNIFGIILIIVANKYDFSLLKYYGIFFLIMFVPALFEILKEILTSQNYSDIFKKNKKTQGKTNFLSDKYYIKKENLPVLTQQWIIRGEIGKRFAEYNFNFFSLDINNKTAVLRFDKKVFKNNYDKEVKSILKEAIDCMIILSDYTFWYPDSIVANPSDSDTLFLLERDYFLGLPVIWFECDYEWTPPDLS